ncbi:GGDEF domain-containing protein [Neobacillus kokaensis]|uniref:GGDEF domain-containing protein n=1 Tax=Neobacillus kokaensis TaxID=2759023 RepID=A0ABQ3N0Y2_9BACI|nr:GGDEF domain-containing protein [Neobacillus kokaensis]GHH97312.1 hypothetical protein AM1BK_08550 [Neobacillus kokaensis]
MGSLEKDLLSKVKLYKSLFLISEKLHSFMNVEALIGELTTILNETFPNFSYYLHLSSAACSKGDFPIIELEYDSKNIALAQSFASGEVQFEHSSVNLHTTIYAPIKGNKEVYGVLQLVVPDTFALMNIEIEFISTLLESAGNALDNAKIYQESQQLISTLTMLNEAAKTLVITDYLTKLHSRRLLDEKIHRSMKEDEQGSFILIDIDNFKNINDTYGHQIGDEVLVQVANLIKTSIRENDIGARWGGEELAIYLPKVSLEDGAAIAKRLAKKVAEKSKPRITVSCGVSYWQKEIADSYKYLFKRADEALYSAKSTGKNKVVTQKDDSKVS